jgi:hypothetical protein
MGREDGRGREELNEKAKNGRERRMRRRSKIGDEVKKRRIWGRWMTKEAEGGRL